MNRGPSIVVGWDFEGTADAALAWAANQARLTGSRIVLAHVLVPVVIGVPRGPLLSSITVEELRGLQLRVEQAAAGLDVPHLADVVVGPSVASALAEVVARHDAALLCVGHGRGGLVSMVLGSVASQVVRQSPVPVVVVRKGWTGGGPAREMS
jgi:nucleotide-binding universal stress UspA family protein